MPKFEEFNKIARLSRDCVITEKIDGTNAQVAIFEEWEMENLVLEEERSRQVVTSVERTYDVDKLISGTLGALKVPLEGSNYFLMAGSRTRWIWPGSDNYGFAKWAWDHAEELVSGLGSGKHFGEWWGQGIQRGYGLKEKRFSLFNTSRWTEENKPACCHVVPVLYQGIFSTTEVWDTLGVLETYGSFASPRFMDPEGVVIYHTAAGIYFKKTVLNDESPKSLVENATPA